MNPVISGQHVSADVNVRSIGRLFRRANPDALPLSSADITDHRYRDIASICRGINTVPSSAEGDIPFDGDIDTALALRIGVDDGARSGLHVAVGQNDDVPVANGADGSLRDATNLAAGLEVNITLAMVHDIESGPITGDGSFTALNKGYLPSITDILLNRNGTLIRVIDPNGKFLVGRDRNLGRTVDGHRRITGGSYVATAEPRLAINGFAASRPGRRQREHQGCQ
ncbi:hypothetical protein ACUN9Y_01910 [Halomonas sp. V046]|uniref:hypothetical protein n=1 Tax=Halomonas sp. V046 TaxID=3459611 RepID=UPI0040442D71